MRFLLIMLILANGALSQEKRVHLEFNSVPLEKAIYEVERSFDLRISYADSLVASHRFTLPRNSYTKGEIFAEISRQTSFKIVEIDKRYFALQPSGDSPSVMLQEVVVAELLSRGIRKSGNRILVSPSKVEELPGVTDADILFSLQQLPGVKSPNETASGLHIRGGTPDQNLILWDGIRMYHPGHLFGMISGFNPNFEQQVLYYNKGTDPKFGERVAGTIDIFTSAEVAKKLQVKSGLNALSADAYIHLPVVAEKLSLQVSGRKSFTEWVQSPTFNSLARKVFQNTTFREFNDENTFGFGDASMRMNYTPSDKALLSVSAILIDNKLDFSSGFKDAKRNQYLAIQNKGSSFLWRQAYGRLRQDIIFHYSSYDFDYRRRQNFDSSDFQGFRKLNRITDSGVQADFGFEANNEIEVDFGYQLSGNDVSHAFTGESDDLIIDLDQNHGFNISHSGYANLKYDIETWNVTAGLRFTEFSLLSESRLEPRAVVEKRFGNFFTANMTLEHKSQIMTQVRETVANDLSLENYVWTLSQDGGYPIQESAQYSGGITYKNRTWLVDADAYYKKLEGVTSLAFGFLHQFDSSLHLGEGFTKGIDLLVQKTEKDWRTWFTYTYQDTRNRYEGINDGAYFPVNPDIRHAVSISVFKKWNRFNFSAGWFWHTGKPYSRIDAENRIIAFNDRRLPAYHRLDISFSYAVVRKDWTSQVGFSILNVYDRTTIISREYERDYATAGGIFNSDFTQKDYRSLGFTPNIFLKLFIL